MAEGNNLIIQPQRAAALLVDDTIAALEHYGGHYFEPGRLSIEITETALLADFDTARYTIQQLRAAGMRIVLDDFGAGHSWIGYLREMVFDAIKIDGTLVDNIVYSQESRA